MSINLVIFFSDTFSDNSLVLSTYLVFPYCSYGTPHPLLVFSAFSSDRYTMLLVLLFSFPCVSYIYFFCINILFLTKSFSDLLT